MLQLNKLIETKKRDNSEAALPGCFFAIAVLKNSEI